MLQRLTDFFKGYEASGPIEYIVAGLGNPGKEYENTRHNMGFLALDAIARSRGFTMKRLKHKSLCGDTVMAGKRVLFMKPTTYMNKSGEAIADAMRFYKIPPERLIVIYDDVALPFGKLRIRKSGSDGGQKGVKNIIYLLGRNDFPRLRIGIGAKPHPGMEMSDWVLSRLSRDELKALGQVLEQCDQALELMLSGDVERAMARFNTNIISN